MRDCSNNRAGFDRLLMSVAATLLAVSASSALAQGDPVRNSAAELAIDAAIPRPEPVNLPPPSIKDFKADPNPAAAETATSAEKAAASKPSDVVTSAPADAGTLPAKAAMPAAEPAREQAKETPKEEKESPKAASNVPPADQPIADKLRDMLGAKSVRYFDRKAERAAVERFYGAREFAPLWTQGGTLTQNGKGVIARLKDGASEGLNASDYPVPDFNSGNPDVLAEADLKLTASMLDYARQAQSGRMHWSQVSGDIQYPEHPTDPNEVLTNVTTAKDASAALDGYNPPHKLYRELKAKLAELRGQGGGPVIQIAEGPALNFIPARGKKESVAAIEDPRVPQVRAKLGITENADSTHYDSRVAEAVRKFQEAAELKPTGILDDRTVRALNSPKRDRQIDTVIVNMERWRWLPRQLGAASLGNAYVILNVPDYTLKVMHNGAQVWNTRVVTGKPGIHATPLLTETMKFITVNPTWNVPPSIIYNEYLPALEQDPTVLQRMGLRLERASDGSIHISQPPGDANALGRIRFNFPNKFLVYQHDTPDKNLFAKEERAFSHGCMRVQNPDQYAATLLNITMSNERYTPEKIRSMYGHSEIDLKFPTPIPVNITYQTAFVDEAGKLQLRKDVYGRDAAMVALLRNTRAKDLENVVAHSQPSYSRPTGNLPAGVNFASDNVYYGPSYSSGPSFFERLFGPPIPPASIPGRRQPPRRIITR
ncbi:MAG: murein L,D-transpeptidase [Alphaproteobacteria bacterium]|nr:MAG: murein L,D-transpeptidase [Alphaproteobacteria bacterium]